MCNRICSRTRDRSLETWRLGTGALGFLCLGLGRTMAVCAVCMQRVMRLKQCHISRAPIGSIIFINPFHWQQTFKTF